jgi:hypothetical protein
MHKQSTYTGTKGGSSQQAVTICGSQTRLHTQPGVFWVMTLLQSNTPPTSPGHQATWCRYRQSPLSECQIFHVCICIAGVYAGKVTTLISQGCQYRLLTAVACLTHIPLPLFVLTLLLMLVVSSSLSDMPVRTSNLTHLMTLHQLHMQQWVRQEAHYRLTK